jgi:hypothetical protein
MDRVHGFGSWVHGIVDHSWTLILWSAAQILLKQKGTGNLILTLHLQADGSHQTRPTRVVHRSGMVAPWGGSLELRSRALRAQRREVFGAKRCGVDGVLTQDETQRGTAPRWLTAAAPLLRVWTTVSGGSGTLSASRSSSTPSLWPPLASPDNGLARAATGQWHTAATRVWFLRIKIWGI